MLQLLFKSFICLSAIIIIAYIIAFAIVFYDYKGRNK